MYMGWPYYAWSAGYDTYYRAAQAKTNLQYNKQRKKLKKLSKRRKNHALQIIDDAIAGAKEILSHMNEFEF